MIWAIFISLAVALLTGSALATNAWPGLGHWIDAFFGASFATFVGLLVALITRRMMLTLADPQNAERPVRGTRGRPFESK